MRPFTVSAVLLLLLPAAVFAADLRITDTRGTEVIVHDVSIDYPAGIAAVRETNGIRVQQGDATVTVKWQDLQSLTVVGQDNLKRPDRLDLDIVLRSGRRLPAAVTRANETKLRGKTDLGEYTIDLDKVRAIATLGDR
jgi:hypothetical protein